MKAELCEVVGRVPTSDEVVGVLLAGWLSLGAEGRAALGGALVPGGVG